MDASENIIRAFCASRPAARRRRRPSSTRAGTYPPPPAPPRPAPSEPALTARPRSRLADTPDLVLDLPARAADAADAFALNRDTLRRRPAAARAPEPGGSPVPARNTLRVAAKFAELTLTGGSLKPALAAKPALLRRPTPHPRAPPPAAPP